ncbi:CBS domain-containing protein [Enterococcus gilvus]|uniref:CBS domain-containing protein n=1 Tax=Enterococcus gilvus TaxID=160453 RepID=UPI003527CD69
MLRFGCTEKFLTRTDITSINSKKSTEEIAELFESSGLSRLPYCQDNIDEITGVVYQKDFYYHVLKGEKKLEEIIKPISFIPKSMKVSELMKKFQAEQIHIAIIIDEHGGTAGLVTLENIIEELVGEIWDEYDSKKLDYYKLADGSFLVNGRSDFDCLKELFNITNTTNSISVAGYILASIERIPM